MQAICETLDALDEDDEEKADALQEEGDRVGEQLQALEEGLLNYSPNVKAAAGVIVTLDRQGQIVVHRGLMREAEARALRTLERLRQGFSGEGDTNGEDDEQPKTAAMSDRLAQRLSAHRTAALQIELARHPQAALAATVHGMAQTVLQRDRYHRDSLPLGVSLTVQDRLDSMAPDWPESPAAVALHELQQGMGEKLPEDSAELRLRKLQILGQERDTEQSVEKSVRKKVLFDYCTGAFKEAIERAKIELPLGQLTHMLRHTFASHFMINGGNILTLQRILGHQDLKTIMRYAHLAPDHLEAARKLNPISALTLG